MKTLTFVRPHNLGKLHDELLAAGVPLPLVDGCTPVQGRGNEIMLTVPDDADEQLIAAVVAAHDPTAVPAPDPDAELEAAIAAATTLEELKDALLGKVRAGQAKGRAVEAPAKVKEG